MASLHTLTGYYSVLTPIGMVMLTILSPFKFSEEKDNLTDIESQRIKSMTNVRVVYFFIFTLLATAKAMHYEAVETL
jgi:hypothetical protein